MGNFTLPLALGAKEVIGVEENKGKRLRMPGSMLERTASDDVT